MRHINESIRDRKTTDITKHVIYWEDTDYPKVPKKVYVVSDMPFNIIQKIWSDDLENRRGIIRGKNIIEIPENCISDVSIIDIHPAAEDSGIASTKCGSWEQFERAFKKECQNYLAGLTVDEIYENPGDYWLSVGDSYICIGYVLLRAFAYEDIVSSNNQVLKMKTPEMIFHSYVEWIWDMPDYSHNSHNPYDGASFIVNISRKNILESTRQKCDLRFVSFDDLCKLTNILQ